MIVFGTGHRPEDSDYNFNAMYELAAQAIANFYIPIQVAVCGMAAGFDLAWGLAALDSNVEVWAVKPWTTHHARFTDRSRYAHIERHASKVVVVHDISRYPGPWVYNDRNEWMVDNSQEGVAFWNGMLEGGTFNCVDYARRRDVPVHNIYPGLEGLVK